MVLDPIPQSLPVHFFGSRPQPPTSRTRAAYSNQYKLSLCLSLSLALSLSLSLSHKCTLRRGLKVHLWDKERESERARERRGLNLHLKVHLASRYTNANWAHPISEIRKGAKSVLAQLIRIGTHTHSLFLTHLCVPWGRGWYLRRHHMCTRAAHSNQSKFSLFLSLTLSRSLYLFLFLSHTCVSRGGGGGYLSRQYIDNRAAHKISTHTITLSHTHTCVYLEEETGIREGAISVLAQLIRIERQPLQCHAHKSVTHTHTHT